MDKPDKIWAWQFKDAITGEDVNVGEWYTDDVELDGDEVPYLLATPERELASELVEALRVYSDPCDADDHGTCPYEGNMCCRAARAVLAKLEGKA